jgi:hypothetical protein
MAYMDDAAVERERVRQKLLANAPPIALGDAARQQMPLPAPTSAEASPGSPFDAVMQQLGSLNLAPGGVQQTPGTPLQAPQVSPRISAPGSSTWKNDDTLGKILTGAGSGIADLLKRLQQPAARPGAPSPQQLIPGLQPPIDASKAMPGTPAARAYMQQHTPGPGVTGVERPPQGPSESATLADQRKPYAAQLDANPALKERLAAVMLAEEGGDPTARTALAESALNRGVSRGIPSLDAVVDPNYYAVFRDGGYQKALGRLRSDPQLRAQVYSDMDRASHGGSNVSNLATDNASGQVAANAKTNSTHTWTAGNGETFTRKDVRPDVHGAQAVARTKDWANNTTGAMATEKPATTQVATTSANAPTQQAKPLGEPPSWFSKETLGTPSTLQPGAPLPPSGGFVDTVQPGGPPRPDANASNMSIQPGQPATPPQAPAVAPQPPPQTPPPTPPQAPPPQAARPAPPSGVDAAHKVLDTKVSDLVKQFAPDQAGSVPAFIGDKTLRQAIQTPMIGGQVRSQLTPYLSKLGLNPQDFEKAVSSPPAAPGKRSEGTSDATDFSARSRTPPGEPPAPGPGELPTQLPGAVRPVDVPKGPQPTITPEMMKAIENAVKDQGRPPGLQAPPPGALPVPPADTGPPVPGLPGAAPGAPGVGPGVSLPAPVSPLMVTPGSQGNPIAMAGVAPEMPNALQPPIPYSDMQGWGWNTGSTAPAWGGWTMGGFDGGLGGFSGGE